VRFSLIATEKACYPVALMCRVLQVSRSGYYAWHKRPVAERRRQDQDQRLALEVAAIHAESRGRYGSRCTTDAGHGMAIKGNLLARRFAVSVPNSGWVSDITYLWTLEGWLYLAVVLDLFSRRVVGWSLSERLERRLALDALGMALKQRLPSSGMLHHSDRGSQYASHEYQQLLAQYGILSSMSRSGNCWDNAVAESFFATLKLELVYQTRWATRAEARSAVFEYTELFYNRKRRHSALGYLCPIEFEHRHDASVAA
jgi:putative transposase